MKVRRKKPEKWYTAFFGYSNAPLLIFMHLCLVSAGQAISEPGTDHLDDAGRGPGPGSAIC